MSILDITNNPLLDIVSSPFPSLISFNADIDPLLLQTSSGLSATRIIIEGTITSVPLPAPALLLISGLAGLFTVGRKQRNT